MSALAAEAFRPGFTSDLLASVESTRRAVDAFSARTRASARKQFSSHEDAVSKQRDILRMLMEVDVPRERKAAHEEDREHRELMAQREAMWHEAKEIRKRVREDLPRELEQLRKDEAREKVRAEIAMSKKLESDEAKMVTINDLTRGVLHYKTLGLDFERNEQNHTRLIFTQIDPSNPSKKFAFTISVNEDNEYEIYDIFPLMRPSHFTELLAELNGPEEDNQDSFRRFLLGMRKEFQHLCS